MTLLDTLISMMTTPASHLLHHDRITLERMLPFCAPVPALALGVIAMQQAGVPAGAWLTNIAASAAGLILLAIVRCIPIPSTRWMQLALAMAGIAVILLTFTTSGVEGVHRWLSLGGLRVHASSIVAPLIIASVAAIARVQIVAAVAIAALTTIILALQPDAAQATSFAAACSTLLMCDFGRHRIRVSAGVTLLLVLGTGSFARRDPLPPVPHVEGILALLGGGSTGWAALGTVALLLLPLPFFAQFGRHRDAASLALGVYVALITLAPFWGTFPVPIMGYGVSPIVGYFVALALCHRTPPVGGDTSSTMSLVSA